MVRLDVASVTYTLADGRPLLRDVSLAVSGGERVALIGRERRREKHAAADRHWRTLTGLQHGDP